MTSFAAEERALEEREYEDEVQAALRARSFDAIHDLQVSASALAEAIRRRAVAERDDRRDLRQAIERCAAMWETQECDGRCSRCEAVGAND